MPIMIHLEIVCQWLVKQHLQLNAALFQGPTPMVYLQENAYNVLIVSDNQPMLSSVMIMKNMHVSWVTVIIMYLYVQQGSRLLYSVVNVCERELESVCICESSVDTQV